MKFATGILLALFMASVAFSGTVDQNLAEKMANSDPNTLHTTLIFMADQLDLETLKQHHDQIQATRAQRHAEVVTSLQEIATASQADLLAYLEGAKSRGTVGHFRGFWITNMIVADLTAAEIEAVASRDEVAVVYPDFKGELIKPVERYPSDPSMIARVESGLRAVRADSMWAHGYTGRGRLVCNIDTGVQGSHPALTARWRGNNGHPPEESWLDTADPSNTVPHDEGDHGTHTMGTICGHGTVDTIGVAIDAQWIAARAIDVTGGNVAAAFEWAADPDGNPNTVEDVPDAICNSWGSLPSPGNECPPSYYNLIDNCEAAGAVVVFAAGNEGTSGLRIPANRITTPYNIFSVGAVDGSNNNFPIASFSSRGPSQCDGVTKKPEIVAPGVNVRSSLPGGSYGLMSGTSMACPHVTGAVALLRQVNPNASTDTIKWALMQAARDLPFSNPNGEDNIYGWGMMDINAARMILPAINGPYLTANAAYVVEPNDNYPDPGETISLFIRLQNTGLAASNVAAIISDDDIFSTITQDSAFFGAIAQNDTGRSSNAFVMSFSSSTPPGRLIAFDVHITADGGYQADRRLFLRVGHLAELAIATHDTGNVAFTISNFGRYGVPPDGIDGVWQGRGFRMPRTGANNLFEGAMLMGTGPDRVSDAARNEDQTPGPDFQPIAAIALFEPGQFAHQEYHTVFNDQGATNPLGVQVTQRSFANGAAPDNDYVITEYVISNTNADTIRGLLMAHFEDWDIPWGAPTPGDRANFDRTRNLGYVYNSTTHRGQQVLSEFGVFSFKALDNTNEVYPPHFTKAEKWTYMNAGTTDTAITANMDASIMITTGPYDIAPGDSVVAAFSILGGTSLADLRANADAAIARYAAMTPIEENTPHLPGGYFLLQNYPNPFNASTTIRFNLPSRGHARLETFDLLGRKVATLVDASLEAGAHGIVWDCGKVPSGIYFYRLTFGEKSQSGKMTLLK